MKQFILKTAVEHVNIPFVLSLSKGERNVDMLAKWVIPSASLGRCVWKPFMLRQGSPELSRRAQHERVSTCSTALFRFIDYQRPAAGRRFFAAMLALALGGMAGSAYGACDVNTTNIVSFGVYDVFSSTDNVSGSGNINVKCDGLLLIGVSYTILLSTGGSGSYASRSMSDGGGHTLSYNLYTDANRLTPVWGDGTGGTATVSGSFPLGLFSRNRDHAVYGRIPAGQNAYVGSYSDTIIVTVNY